MNGDAEFGHLAAQTVGEGHDGEFRHGVRREARNSDSAFKRIPDDRACALRREKRVADIPAIEAMHTMRPWD